MAMFFEEREVTSEPSLFINDCDGRGGDFHQQPLGAKSELSTASLRPDWRIGARDSSRGLDLVLCRTAGAVIGIMFGGRYKTRGQSFFLVFLFSKSQERRDGGK